MFLGGILIFVIGLAMGSFVNVLLYRLAPTLMHECGGEPRPSNFITGRSRCPRCSFQLNWFDLIPVLSFLLLGGKCRSCKKRISISYPLTELSAGVLAFLAWSVFYQNPWLAVFWIVVLLFLLTLFFFDLRYYILPDGVLIALLVFTVFYRLMVATFNKQLALVPWSDALLAGLGLLLLLGAVWFFSKGRWLGFGDVKYGFVVGLIFGVYGAFAIFYGAILVGGTVAVVLLLTKRANLKTKLPFGTFISLASVIYIFYQVPINNFLQTLL